MKNVTSLAVLLLYCFSTSFAQNLLGTWKTVDDNDGEAKSFVSIYKGNDGMVYGKIIKILNESDADEVCNACKDHRKDQPILGMEVITGMIEEGDIYKKGKILDPKNGKEYRCKLWLDDTNTLMVRGYLGPFYRTQTWFRVD